MKIKQGLENSQFSTEEALTNLIGRFGKWQFLVFTMVSASKVSSAWVQMNILFLTPLPAFRCVELANGTALEAEWSRCVAECARYEVGGRSVVAQWQLVCGRRWLASLTQTLLQLGVLVGSVLFGFLSDRFGRKNTFLWSMTLVIIIAFGVPFSPNYWVFTALRFFLGIACAGTMVVSFVLIMEVTSTSYRELLGCLYIVPYVLGQMSIPLFAYLFPSWQSYCLALAVPQVLYLMYFVFLPESPRWLASVGKIEEATKIVESAAKMNKRPTTNIADIICKMSAHLTSRSTTSQYNYLHLFRRSLLVRTLAVSFIWFSTGICFFGFNQYISQTSSNPYISSALAGFIQLPSIFSVIVLIKRFGRRRVLIVNFLLSGACVLSLGLVPRLFWLTTTLSTTGMLFCSNVAAVLYVYTSELYPTVIRNMAIGTASTTMRIGSMIAPFVSNITVVWVPPLIIGLIQILGGLVCIALPETKGNELPDNMEDIEEKNQRKS